MTAPEVTPAAAPSTGTTASALSLDDLRARAASKGMSPRLLGDLIGPWLQRGNAAFADGTLGFVPDVSAIRFPSDPATLSRLKTGVEHSILTGAIVTAYPAKEEVRHMARLRAARRATTIDGEESALLAMPVTTFLAEHFVGRGGVLYDKEARIAEWAKLRWPTDGYSLPALFKEMSLQQGIDPSAWLDLHRNRTSDYDRVHRAVYDALPPQPLLRDVLGTATLTITDVRRDMPKVTPLLKDDATLRTEPQGSGLSFIRLLRDDVSLLTPPEFLALASAMSEPAKPNTYPDPTTWEWLGGITPTSAAGGCSVSGGLALRWDHPEFSSSNCRARSVVR